jgi:tRNA (cytidine/uridine-2'-O-)-methyltransferase
MVKPNASIGLVLHQPEIAGNTGTLMRLAACWNAPLVLIGPLGFVWSDRHLKRSGMDYAEKLVCSLHESWSDYRLAQREYRHIAVVPHRGLSYTDFIFRAGDHLIMGSESCGLPSSVMDQCHETIHIPMVANVRSLNLAIASAIVWSQALIQTQGMPRPAE